MGGFSHIGLGVAVARSMHFRSRECRRTERPLSGSNYRAEVDQASRSSTPTAG